MKAGQRYFVKVGLHEYRCCGGGWSTRNEGEYTGQAISVNGEEFLLQVDNRTGGKMAEVIAALCTLEELRSVD